MKLLKKVLLATDFSEQSRAALCTAISLGRTFDSEIIPLHVLCRLPDFVSRGTIDVIRSAVTRELHGIKDAIEKEQVRAADPLLVEGEPFEQIISCASGHNVNVIVMSAKSDLSAGPTHLGTTAERVVRRSAIPVWVVSKSAPTQIGKILCAVDCSSHSERALRNAVHLARAFKAKLAVLNVTKELSTVFSVRCTVEAQAAYMEERQRRFDQFLKGFHLHGIEIEKHIKQGTPPREIVSFVKEWGADLLVMGSAGRSGLARVFMGSVAEKVLQAMPCSVITVKAEHAIRLDFEEEVKELGMHLKRGNELLEKGFPYEALTEFQRYVAQSPVSIPGWEAMSATHERLGNEKEAEACRRKADYIRDTVWKDLVQSEARRNHPLWKH